MQNIEPQIKATLDVVSIYTVVATIYGWLPAIAALFTIVWTTLQIYDWFKRHLKKK